MKPFNLDLAKAGHPVCTRDGRDARILCFDKKAEYFPIVALILNNDDEEELVVFKLDGTYLDDGETSLDLFMKPEKKEGWINIYFLNDGGNTCFGIYDTKEDALSHKCADGYVDTIKIEWEE